MPQHSMSCVGQITLWVDHWRLEPSINEWRISNSIASHWWHAKNWKSDSWNHRSCMKGSKYTRSWRFNDDRRCYFLAIFQIYGTYTNHHICLYVECNMGNHFNLFMIFCHRSKNGVSSRLIAPAKFSAGNHLVSENSTEVTLLYWSWRISDFNPFQHNCEKGV